MMRAVVQNEASEVLDRSVSGDLWRNTLSRIQSIFGRLTYLADLRDPNSGRYEHHGMALVFGAEEAHNALRRSHAEVFAEWLRMDLEGQHADLALYLAGLSDDRSTVIATWTEVQHYQTLVPSSIRGPERKLYIANLHALIKLMRNQDTACAPDPTA